MTPPDDERAHLMSYCMHPSWALLEAFAEVRRDEAAKWQAEVNELRSEVHALKEGKL